MATVKKGKLITTEEIILEASKAFENYNQTIKSVAEKTIFGKVR